MTRYIDPTTDYGFKRLFARHNSPDSQEILKHFLYEVLALPHPITSLEYLPTEQTPDIALERVGIYDVYCIDSEGNQFVVEMQRNRRSYYKERALYYATFPISQQVQRGEEGPPFRLLPIYVTSVLNFWMDNRAGYLRRVRLMDKEDCTVFYPGLTFVFLELPKFTLRMEELTTGTEKWLYLLRHLPVMESIPEPLQTDPYTLAFKAAEEANLTRNERMLYQASWKQARDEQSLYYTGREEGREEGLIEGEQRGERRWRIEMARAMLADSMAPSTVARYTGLSDDEVAALRHTPSA